MTWQAPETSRLFLDHSASPTHLVYSSSSSDNEQYYYMEPSSVAQTEYNYSYLDQNHQLDGFWTASMHSNNYSSDEYSSVDPASGNALGLSTPQKHHHEHSHYNIVDSDLVSGPSEVLTGGDNFRNGHVSSIQSRDPRQLSQCFYSSKDLPVRLAPSTFIYNSNFRFPPIDTRAIHPPTSAPRSELALRSPQNERSPCSERGATHAADSIYRFPLTPPLSAADTARQEQLATSILARASGSMDWTTPNARPKSHQPISFFDAALVSAQVPIPLRPPIDSQISHISTSVASVAAVPSSRPLVKKVKIDKPLSPVSASSPPRHIDYSLGDLDRHSVTFYWSREQSTLIHLPDFTTPPDNSDEIIIFPRACYTARAPSIDDPVSNVWLSEQRCVDACNYNFGSGNVRSARLRVHFSTCIARRNYFAKLKVVDGLARACQLQTAAFRNQRDVKPLQLGLYALLAMQSNVKMAAKILSEMAPVSLSLPALPPGA